MLIVPYFVDKMGDYGRNNTRRTRGLCDVVSIVCDLIVHSRGEIVGKDNLIALEMKKAYRKVCEIESDKARLVALTKDSYDEVWSFDGKMLPEHVCGYELGIYYEIDRKCSSIYVEYYTKGKILKSYTLIIC